MVLKKKATEPIDTLDIDKEGGGGSRQLQGTQGIIIAAVAVGLALFAIYSNSFMNIQEIYRNSIFLAFVFVLGFLVYPATKYGDRNKFSVLDAIFAIVGLSGALYIIINYSTIHSERMSQPIIWDYVFAIITILAMLEVARRSVGIFIPLLTLGAIV